MSLETTRARADADAADTAWHTHRRACPPCVTAWRAHQPARMCVTGHDLYRAHKDAEAVLEEQRELDAQPIPGQGTLW